jgi:hypothetical protein
MDAAHTIRDAVSKIIQLRLESVSNPQLGASVAAVKRFQSRRFAFTYGDILKAGPYQNAAQFFLEELYGEKDYSHRDTQFARIAGAMQKLLPKAAVATAVLLAELHLLTEELDHAMGAAWLALVQKAGAVTSSLNLSPLDSSLTYVKSWQNVGRRDDRRLQLEKVLEMGRDLDRLTKTHGLRLVLKMMRRPAEAAGLGDLQHFLEHGFDTFAQMGQHHSSVAGFLSLIEQRESALMDDLFSEPAESMAKRFGGM